VRRNQRKGLPNFTVGILVLAFLAAATYLGFTKSIPFRHHYTIEAVFPSANNIRPGSPVRIAGVDIGKVSGVEHVPGGGQAAIVKMRIERKGLPIHKDARVKIRPRIFLEGNFFVDVNPGSPTAPVLGDGDRLPINQASGPVQLDQVLTALQSDTRKDLRGLLRELASGLQGDGARGYNASIPYWQPAYRDSAIVNDALRGQVEGDLAGYVKNAGATAEALDRNSVQLKSLITDFNTTAHAFAVQDTALSDAVGELPRTLRAGRPALDQLNAAFPSVRRFIVAARPAVRSSGPALDAGVPLAREVRGLVSPPELRGLTADLRPTVPALTRLNQETSPLYEQVRSASSCQNEVILPWTKDKIQDKTFPATGRVFEEATKPLPGLAGESRSGDANGQWFRVLVAGGNYAYPLGTDKFFLTNFPLEGANPPVPKDHKRTPLRPDVPCETQQPPDLRTVPSPAPEGYQASVPNTPQAKAAQAKALQQTVDFLRHQIKVTGSDLKVTDQPLSLDAVKNLGGAK
jgi:virulence factor Mce-like protein